VRRVSFEYMATPADEFDATRIIVDQLKDFSAENQQMIIKWACEKLGVSQPSLNPSSVVVPLENVAESLTSSVLAPAMNIKSFVEEKDPKTDMHFATVVAYYYRFVAQERKETISAEDLQEATRLGGRRRLSNPAKTMSNATSAGLLDNAGRGLYRVNTVGENLVAMVLPDGAMNGAAPKRKAAKKVAKKVVNKKLAVRKKA
jgi:hypothetical protein